MKTKHGKITVKSSKALFLMMILFFGISHASAAQWEVGSGQTYTSIQEAIDNSNTLNDDVINVHDGIYAEDVIIDKKLTVQANTGDDVEIKPVKTAFTVVKNASDDGSGSTINGFKITNSATGIGVNISADHCTVKNNHISLGKTGIMALGNKTLVKNNTINDVGNNSIQVGSIIIIIESGIPKNIVTKPNNCKVENNHIMGGLVGIAVVGDNTIINDNEIRKAKERGISLFGCNPTISRNKITEIVGSGPKAGIQLATINFTGSTGLTITGNTISNINSTNETVLGIDAFAMTMNSTINSILILENKITNLYSVGKSTALSIVALALNGPISTIDVTKNTINNVYSQCANSTSTAISVVAMGFKNDTKTYNNTTTCDQITISKNKITNIISEDENSTSKGISFVGLCGGNSSISENNLSNFRSDSIVVGISSAGVDYTNFQSNVTINNNIITDLTANKMSSGILSANLGDSNLLHNNIFRIKSAKTKYMLVQTPLKGKATIKGNNLEGTGVGEGIAVNGNHTIINYNRIVNFQHFIQNINNSESMEFSQGKALPTDKQIREYLLSKNGTYTQEGMLINLTEENITAIISNYHNIMDAMDKVTSNTTAPYNWYGANNPSSEKFLKGHGTLNYSPWLVLKIKAKPSTINTGETSTITADVYHDADGGDHSADAALFFSGPQVTFTTNLGNVGSKSVVVEWVNGIATAFLRGDEGPGTATVTAADYKTVLTLVTILGEPAQPLVHATTIGMQGTGTLVNYLILAMIMVMSGLILPRKK